VHINLLLGANHVEKDCDWDVGVGAFGWVLLFALGYRSGLPQILVGLWDPADDAFGHDRNRKASQVGAEELV